MATVYSLVCWGGRTGKSVTASNSGGLIFTSTNHGLRDGTALMFSGTTLPGNVSSIVPYYTQSLSANTFAIYTEAELTNRVAWSSAGSGVIAKSKKMLDYLASPPTPNRWGEPETERCYDGIANWHAARTSLTTALTVEVCELGQAFSEALTGSATVNVNMPAAAVRIESKIDGVRTEAWHGGNVSSITGTEYGYVLKSISQSTTVTYLSLWAVNAFADGFSILRTNTNGYGGTGVNLGFNGEVRNIIAISASVSGTGMTGGTTGAGCRFVNCLAIGFGTGFYGAQYVERIGFYNCIAIKNGNGFGGPTSSYYAVVINCIALGNTTANWGTTAGLRFATNNLGGTGEAWITTGGTRIEVAESSPFSTTFAGFTNNDVRPYSISSAQVDSGIEYYGALGYDIADNERPNYNNGGSEDFDVGCYEFYHGYGDHPITASLTLTGLATETDVVVRAAGTSTILDSVDSTSGNWTYTYGSAHNVDIDVIKPGMVIVTFRNLALTAESSIIPVSQQFDRNYS